MMVWILLVGFLLLALAMVLIPVFRYQADDNQHQNKNIAVYKAQLQELEADQNNGVLSEAEAASARLEIERRLLKIAGTSDSQHNNGTSTTLLIVITTVVLLISAGFYLRIGMPGMPDFILKDQDHSVTKRAEKNKDSENIIREIAEIKAHLIEKPENIKALRALGHYQSQLRNKAEAAQAYQRWFELEPDNIDAAVVYAESLIMLSEGRIGPAALMVLNRAREIQPHNPGARHYLALAQYQAGNISEAHAKWKELEADSKPGAPWLPPLRRWIQQAEKDMGIPQSAKVPALSEDKRAALKDMSPEEQAEMIKGMVARLQEKMDANPENIEGWFQLAKAYEVLGQREKAINSLVQALKHAPDDLKPQIKKQLELLLKQE